LKWDKISVLILCYNDEAALQKVVRDFKIALPEASIDVYDNNPSDSTAKRARNDGSACQQEA